MASYPRIKITILIILIMYIDKRQAQNKGNLGTCHIEQENPFDPRPGWSAGTVCDMWFCSGAAV